LLRYGLVLWVDMCTDRWHAQGPDSRRRTGRDIGPTKLNSDEGGPIPDVRNRRQ
jgi:hypothetical protein